MEIENNPHFQSTFLSPFLSKDFFLNHALNVILCSCFWLNRTLMLYATSQETAANKQKTITNHILHHTESVKILIRPITLNGC